MNSLENKPKNLLNERSKRYLTYLILLMALIAIMDQYLSFIETNAIPYIIKEYNVTESEYSWWKVLYFIPTFLIFLLNGLTDIIGRKYSLLILILLFGIPSLAIVYFTPSFHLYMVFFVIIVYATVSNMWTIPISEEAPAEKRAKLVSLVYFLSLIPLMAIIPLILQRLNLSWKWMYGVMFFFMIPVLILWVFMKETKRYEMIIEERKLGIRKKHFYGLGVINRSDITYILFSAAIWMCWLVVSMMVVWLGQYFNIIGYSDIWYMALLSILVATMIGAVAGGWTMDKIGRKTGIIIGCAGLGLFVGILGFIPIIFTSVIAAVAGFFLGFSYTWIIVYIPEIFPTDRRGACLGWTTTIARFSYILGPALAAILLTPTSTTIIDWNRFWAVAGLIMVIPILLVALFHPYETKTQELEEIEVKR
jgi:MFS family permease